MTVQISLVVLEAWRWPRESLRTPFGDLDLGLELPGFGFALANARIGLGLANADLGLELPGLGLGLEEKVLASASDRGRGQDLSKTSEKSGKILLIFSTAIFCLPLCYKSFYFIFTVHSVKLPC